MLTPNRKVRSFTRQGAPIYFLGSLSSPPARFASLRQSKLDIRRSYSRHPGSTRRRLVEVDSEAVSLKRDTFDTEDAVGGHPLSSSPVTLGRYVNSRIIE